MRNWKTKEETNPLTFVQVGRFGRFDIIDVVERDSLHSAVEFRKSDANWRNIVVGSLRVAANMHVIDVHYIEFGEYVFDCNDSIVLRSEFRHESIVKCQ